MDYLLDENIFLSKILERTKKVGAQSPTNMPNLSPWAWSEFDQGDMPFDARYQTAMLAAMETNPETKQILARDCIFVLFG